MEFSIDVSPFTFSSGVGISPGVTFKEPTPAATSFAQVWTDVLKRGHKLFDPLKKLVVLRPSGRYNEPQLRPVADLWHREGNWRGSPCL